MEITMPRYGTTMETGEISEWYVEVGATVEKGTPLCEISSEKLTNVLEAPQAGTIKELLVEEGDEAAVGAAIAILE